MRETSILTSGSFRMLRNLTFAALAVLGTAGVAVASEEGGMEPVNVRVLVVRLPRGTEAVRINPGRN